MAALPDVTGGQRPASGAGEPGMRGATTKARRGGGWMSSTRLMERASSPFIRRLFRAMLRTFAASPEGPS
jgi:hypothetical protein